MKQFFYLVADRPIMVRLDDTKTPTAQAVLSGTECVGSLAAGDDGLLYFTPGVDVWSAPQTMMR